jgi:hypothetical protein
MLKRYVGERAPTLTSRLVYRGYHLELKRALVGWRVGIHPRRADLPILSRCDVFAADPDEAVMLAKGRIDRTVLVI